MKLGSPLTITLAVFGAAILVIVLYYSAGPMQQLSDAPVFDDVDNTMRYIGALFGRRI